MKKVQNNYIDRIPKRAEKIKWENREGDITLQKKNEGFCNRLFQKMLKKPDVSFVHLDKEGSFIWKNIDGKSSIYDIGQKLKDEFGDEVQPLYERLSIYINTLQKCKFIDI